MQHQRSERGACASSSRQQAVRGSWVSQGSARCVSAGGGICVCSPLLQCSFPTTTVARRTPRRHERRANWVPQANKWKSQPRRRVCHSERLAVINSGAGRFFPLLSSCRVLRFPSLARLCTAASTATLHFPRAVCIDAAAATRESPDSVFRCPHSRPRACRCARGRRCREFFTSPRRCHRRGSSDYAPNGTVRRTLTMDSLSSCEAPFLEPFALKPM